jgi:protein-tyrosine phosphatase
VIRVAFVCLGNICRSPTAEGIFKDLLAQKNRSSEFAIDSFGIGAWHVGNPPDPRAQETARKYGVDISTQSAEQLDSNKSRNWDLLICMDRSVCDEVRHLATKAGNQTTKICLLTELLPKTDARHGSDVPDPYYKTGAFDEVFHLIQEALENYLAQS